MEYDDWTPLGRGDPLKNDPTYDYVPPMLDKVKYWMSDGDNSKKQSASTTNSNEILLLGVSSLKKSTSKPSKKYTAERPNLLDPAYTQNQKNKFTKTTYHDYDKEPNIVNAQQIINNRFINGVTSSDNHVQEFSHMNSEKRIDPLETLLQLVSGKWNTQYSTTPTKPIASIEQPQYHHQLQQQKQPFFSQQQQLQVNHIQQQQELFNQQQQLRQQYEQQLVKVPDMMLIPPVDTTSSNTWFLTEPTDNQLFTQAQNVSNFNFKPADNVTDLYDLVTQNHLVTPTSYDVQTSLKLQDVITQTNYPLVYQSNISTYTPVPSSTPTIIKAQEITPTIYKPQNTPMFGNTITSVNYVSQSNVPIITPIGLKINNIPSTTNFKHNDIPPTHPKLQSSVTPGQKILSSVSNVTPLNFKQNTLFVTPLVYKTNFITEPSKLSQTSWINPSVPSSLTPLTFKLTTPANQAFIKHSNTVPSNFKIQNHQTFPNWKLAQNQINYHNLKFTSNPQQNVHHNIIVHPPIKTNSFPTSTQISTTVAPSTIVFCNHTVNNVTKATSNEKKTMDKYSNPINKTLQVMKQSIPTMNLIIQGHSKVKKYGAAKIDKLSGIAIQDDNKENHSRRTRAVHRFLEANDQKRSRRKRKVRDNFSKSSRQLEVVEELIPVYDDEVEEALQDLLREQTQGSGFGQIEDNSLKRNEPYSR